MSWCPTCRSEYVADVHSCPRCAVRLVDELPESVPDPQPTRPEVSFNRPRPDHTDPWIPVWEGKTIDAEALALSLQEAHIPVDVGEAPDPGHARVQVPQSYIEDAVDIIDHGVAEHPRLVVEHPDGMITWSPTVKLILVLLAVTLLVMILVT